MNRLNPIKRALAALLVVAVSSLICSANAAAQGRGYAGASFALEIDGQFAGFVNSSAGGNTVAEIVKQTSPATPVVKKHLANTFIEPIVLQVGAGMGKPLWDWIASLLRGEHRTASGAIIAVDSQLRSTQRLDFSNALLTEVTFPTLDGSSKDAALWSIAITPERVTQSKPSGAAVPVAPKSKAIVASNFRFELDGLNTSRVAKIDGFTVKQKVAKDSVGSMREPTLQPGELEIPNLTITVPANAAESWQRWFEEFVIQGKHEEQNEKSGRIVLLAANLQEELLEIRLSNVGIYALRRLNNAANKDALPQLEAQLYVERIELNIKALP